jgi:hypothetical protein
MTINVLGTRISLLTNTAGTATVAIAPQANSNTVIEGNALDLTDFEGDIVFIVSSTAAGSSNTVTFTVQDSADGTTFAGLSTAVTAVSAANTALYSRVVVNSNNIRRYVRITAVTSAGNTGHCAAVAFGSKKYGG